MRHTGQVARSARTPEKDRERMRGVVASCEPLVRLLQELYPNVVPPINASDREIGAHIGEQRLIERLLLLLKEARGGATPDGQLPTVITGG